MPCLLLFLAPLLWSLGGCSLLFRGWTLINAAWLGFILPLALGVGLLKSLFILDRIAAESSLAFLPKENGPGFSYQLTALPGLRKTWYFLPLMVLLGLVLRSLPGEFAPITGTVYWAVGCSLCFSSRLAWRRSYKTLRSYGLAQSC